MQVRNAVASHFDCDRGCMSTPQLQRSWDRDIHLSHLQWTLEYARSSPSLSRLFDSNDLGTVWRLVGQPQENPNVSQMSRLAYARLLHRKGPWFSLQDLRLHDPEEHSSQWLYTCACQMYFELSSAGLISGLQQMQDQHSYDEIVQGLKILRKVDLIAITHGLGLPSTALSSKSQILKALRIRLRRHLDNAFGSVRAVDIAARVRSVLLARFLEHEHAIPNLNAPVSGHKGRASYSDISVLFRRAAGPADFLYRVQRLIMYNSNISRAASIREMYEVPCPGLMYLYNIWQFQALRASGAPTQETEQSVHFFCSREEFEQWELAIEINTTLERAVALRRQEWREEMAAQSPGVHLFPFKTERILTKGLVLIAGYSGLWPEDRVPSDEPSRQSVATSKGQEIIEMLDTDSETSRGPSFSRSACSKAVGERTFNGPCHEIASSREKVPPAAIAVSELARKITQMTQETAELWQAAIKSFNLPEDVQLGVRSDQSRTAKDAVISLASLSSICLATLQATCTLSACPWWQQTTIAIASWLSSVKANIIPGMSRGPVPAYFCTKGMFTSKGSFDCSNDAIDDSLLRLGKRARSDTKEPPQSQHGGLCEISRPTSRLSPVGHLLAAGLVESLGHVYCGGLENATLRIALFYQLLSLPYRKDRRGHMWLALLRTIRASGRDDKLRSLEVYLCRQALCDPDLPGGGWLAIQRRMRKIESFNRSLQYSHDQADSLSVPCVRPLHHNLETEQIEETEVKGRWTRRIGKNGRSQLVFLIEDTASESNKTPEEEIKPSAEKTTEGTLASWREMVKKGRDAEATNLGFEWPTEGDALTSTQDDMEARAHEGGLPGYHSVFTSADDADGRVEQMVLQELEGERGMWGAHCEGSFLRTLFALLMWDQLFDSTVPGVLLLPFQEGPLDLDEPGAFYKARKLKIEARLLSLSAMTDAELAAEVYGAWNRNYLVRCRGLSWDRFPVEILQVIAVAITGLALARIFRPFCHHYSYYSGGLPDLLLLRVRPRVSLPQSSSTDPCHLDKPLADRGNGARRRKGRKRKKKEHHCGLEELLALTRIPLDGLKRLSKGTRVLGWGEQRREKRFRQLRRRQEHRAEVHKADSDDILTCWPEIEWAEVDGRMVERVKGRLLTAKELSRVHCEVVLGEVKSKNDALDDRQAAWLHILTVAGLQAKVFKIRDPPKRKRNKST